MRSTHLAAIALTALSGAALAWTPALDEAVAKAVVDAAYRRGPDVATTADLSLTVTNGAFKQGVTVRAHAGGDACVTNWLARPTDYAALGSRPTSVIVAGQASAAFDQAAAARDNFEYLSAADARDRARKTVPDGHLRVYVQIAGLARAEQRDAYQVVALDARNAILRPYRFAFVDDWKQEANRWTGTMVYYFDLTRAGLDANGKLPLLLRTEADTPCAYRIDVDLASFR